MLKSQCGTDPDYSAAICSEPAGWVLHAQSAYFLTYRLADLGYNSNIKTSLRAKYLSCQRSMAKISIVNSQTTKRAGQNFDPQSQL